jgi:choline transporter-like protein 2/4/5
VLCGEDPNCYLSYKWNRNLQYAFIYHFFGLLWINQFIVGLACVTIAGAIGSFYWAGGKEENMPTFPVLVAIKNTFIYHVGSVAFGSLLIAIVMFVR